jgi:hypothetical protein
LFKVILILLFTYGFMYSQIGGISNSKVIVASPEVVGNSILEFEPAFLYSYSNDYWNADSDLISINGDSKKRISSVDFGIRLTYGAFNNFEIGSVIPTDMSVIALGAKYKFLSGDKFILAGFAGMNIYNNSSVIFDKDDEGINPVESGIGLVGKYNFSENFSLDLDAQYLSSIIRGEESHSGDLYLNSEVGYYVGDYQFCAGFSYNNSIYESEEEGQELLSAVFGGTIETAEDFVIIWGIPYDIYGKNIEKSLGFLLAFTISIK